MIGSEQAGRQAGRQADRWQAKNMHKVKVERGGGDAELGCACKTHVPCAVWAADGVCARAQ
eukprot:2550459-Pleurochrysis_carterae.AAC.1